MDFSMGTTTLERSDDILTEILLRLPSKSIFEFTCVTTRWNNVIIDTLFGKLYTERTRRSLACSNPHGRLFYFVQNDYKYGIYITSPVENPRRHIFLPVHGVEYVRSEDLFPDERGFFITCSNDGLFLCGHINQKYYVGNPKTGIWESLPPPITPLQYSMKHASVGLISNQEDEALGGKTINFRVIILTDCFNVYPDYFTDERGVKVIPIETYSSRTRKWRRTNLISETPVNLRDGIAPIFSEGFFHWFEAGNDSIIAYDPSSLDEEDENEHYNKNHVVHVIESPRPYGDVIWRSDNGQTTWFGSWSYQNGVEVFRKCHDNDDWACISQVELDTMKDIIVIPQEDIEYENMHRDRIYMIALIPWDPKLILIRHLDNIYIYDCMSKKSDEVMLDGDRHVTIRRWEFSSELAV